MRLFVAIALDGEAAAEIEKVRQGLAPGSGDLRWSRPADWHVTLQFLGSASGEQAACLMERLGAVRSETVPVRIDGLGFFQRAGVFWAGVERTRELLALEQRVRAAARGCGFIPKGREYRPHITLARSRGRSGAKALAALRDRVERERTGLRAEFTAREFLLYESWPGPEGSRYEVRGRFGLG